MNFDISLAWAKIQVLVIGFISGLSNIVLAPITFTIYGLVARWPRPRQ